MGASVGEPVYVVHYLPKNGRPLRSFAFDTMEEARKLSLILVEHGRVQLEVL